MTQSDDLQSALRACEERFLKAFEESPMALLLSSTKTDRYIEVNHTFERITGWKRSEVIGRTPYEINILVDASQRVSAIQELLSGGMVRDLEVRARMKNGEIRTALVSAALIEFNGETCLLVLGTTDFKPAERARENAERLSSGLIASQDQERSSLDRRLRNYLDQLMLTSVNLDLIQQNRPELATEMSPEIERARARIQDLVSDIQTLSRNLYYSKLEYLGLTRAARSFCKEFSEEKHVDIEFASEGVLEEMPKEISLCLFHVLKEALQNATEHSGSRKFQVSLHFESNEIRLTVHDFGIGFDPEKAAEGPGLGLAILKERLKLVGGELSIECWHGSGATIQARVPLVSMVSSARQTH